MKTHIGHVEKAGLLGTGADFARASHGTQIDTRLVVLVTGLATERLAAADAAAEMKPTHCGENAHLHVLSNEINKYHLPVRVGE